jgi:YedE family putative selenium metabolism protein
MGLMLIIATGVVFGLGAVLLVKAGNPGNYGFCAACHLRDIAGALGIHQVATLQYVRPEILGFVLGAFVFAKASGEFRPRGGSRPLVRVVLGALMMIGALVFLGCPLRGILRLAGGDLNGITGLAGFASGIAVGIVFLKGGYNLGRAQAYVGGVGRWSGYLAAVAAIVLLAGVATQAAWLTFSAKGPGSQHAPVFLSLVAGLVAGGLAGGPACAKRRNSRFLVGPRYYLIKIYAVIFAAALVGNLAFGTFKLGFAAQPLAHTAHLWNFLGSFFTGIAAVLAGGCPLRQLIQAGEGNTDAMFTVLGMLVGAGVSHGLNAASSAAGVTIAGQFAVVGGIAVAAVIGLAFRETITVATEV